MGFGVHAGVVEKFQERVARIGLLCLADVEVEDGTVAGLVGWQCEALSAVEASGVPGSPLPAQVVILVNVLEFGAQDPRVQIVQAAVETETMDVARGRAMVAQ